MLETSPFFVDEFSNVHTRDVVLGRGGQGVVYRTKDADIALKLALDANGDPKPRCSESHQLGMLRLLPIPERLPLSMPLAMLRDHEGYVMRLLGDMVPFKHFWLGGDESASQIELPKWLEAVPESAARELAHYASTGGLRRRLLALYKCSAVLSRLHAAGFVYGDVSPSNAYISEHPESREVWLIDADNLQFDADGKGPIIWTPKFGAPELLQGKNGIGAATDCHAFAVMSFWLLATIHPFEGDYLDNDDSDWAKEETDDPFGHQPQKVIDALRGVREQCKWSNRETLAYAGLVPWVDDEEDDSNSASNGLPRSLVLTDGVRKLFQLTFSDGRIDPACRPVILHWPLALAAALDLCIPCTGCGMGYYCDYADNAQKCPYCGAERPMLVSAIRNEASANGGIEQAWSWLHPLTEDTAAPVKVPHRVLYPFSPVKGDNDVFQISMTDQSITIAPVEGFESTDFELRIGLGGNAKRIPLRKRVILPRCEGIAGFEICECQRGALPVIFTFIPEVP